MIYYDFKNYDEFKELFGIIEHGNGVKSRKNKILLALYKDKQAFKAYVRFLSYREALEMKHLSFLRADNTNNPSSRSRYKHHDLWMSIYGHYADVYSSFPFKDRKSGLVDCKSLVDLKFALYEILSHDELCVNAQSRLLLNGQSFYTEFFETDDFDGLCEDGTVNAIRYFNREKQRVFKMKAGKMFNHILANNIITRDLPEQIKRWLSEEFVADWILYATENLCDKQYTLHVNDSFGKIYNSDCCKGYDEDSDCFGSCMVDDGQHTFYEESISAKAAYLTDGNDMIVARCIVYLDVKDENDKVYRLAERQYSYQSDLGLQRQLVSALIRGGYIDGYKRVGASCHDSRGFVDNEGNSLEDKRFRIHNTIDFGDTLSYQDSFKWLDMDTHTAYNYGASGADIKLDDTSSVLEGEDEDDDHEHERWSEHYDCYIPEEDAYYVEGRDDVFYLEDVVEACHYSRYEGRFRNYTDWEHKDDCIEIDGEYYYAGFECENYGDEGIGKCENCGCFYLKQDEFYSDVTCEGYCCEECMENAEEAWHANNGEVFSNYDSDWYDKEDVVKAYQWISGIYLRSYSRDGKYAETTISKDSLEDLIDDGKATFVNGVAYIDAIGHDGEPAHYLAADLRATA